MAQHFLEQIELLMQWQQMRIAEDHLQNSRNYRWLSNKRPSILWISVTDEYKIRKALTKVDEDQRLKVLKQLVKWLEEHPKSATTKIPEICVKFLEQQDTSNIITKANLSRMSSFRSSLRRLSFFQNRVIPEVVVTQQPDHKCVTFNEELVVYKI
ncbi:uncharacterized protein [Onthophagus taurus]|uniref:uncharacterized protein n=1 Tax=Onthophagus taurus TaxID=166361 RepID=UPI000C1FEAD7|nr:uncharacterized protein LOC111423584 [Onthophagus taurus]